MPDKRNTLYQVIVKFTILGSVDIWFPISDKFEQILRNAGGQFVGAGLGADNTRKISAWFDKFDQARQIFEDSKKHMLCTSVFGSVTFGKRREVIPPVDDPTRHVEYSKLHVLDTFNWRESEGIL